MGIKFSVPSYDLSIVGHGEVPYTINQALVIINKRSGKSFNEHDLITAAANNQIRFMMKISQGIPLVHEKTLLNYEDWGTSSERIIEGIECFRGYFYLHDSDPDLDWLCDLSEAQDPRGICSVTKRYANGYQKDFRIGHLKNLFSSSEEAELSYFLRDRELPEWINTSEFVPEAAAIRISEDDIELFLTYLELNNTDTAIGTDELPPSLCEERDGVQSIDVDKVLNDCNVKKGRRREQFSCLLEAITKLGFERESIIIHDRVSQKNEIMKLAFQLSLKKPMVDNKNIFAKSPKGADDHTWNRIWQDAKRCKIIKTTNVRSINPDSGA